jgi:chromosome segregation ATPase
LREFIQRDGEETYKEMSQRKKFCEVEAQFVVKGGRKLSFRRRLFPNEKQEFAIDGEEYSQRVYENFLMRCNLNFMTANYAIWQGEVDKLLLKNPKELTALFETVSGSAYFRNDQQELKKELSRIEEVVQAETAKLVKLRLERKNIKKMHISKDSSAKSQADYERVVRRMLLAKMCMGEMEIKEAER